MAFSDFITRKSQIWDPTPAPQTPASRDYHSNSEDYYLGHPLPLPLPPSHDFHSRAASQLEIWGIATGTCFLTLLLCSLLWSAIAYPTTTATTNKHRSTARRPETRTAHPTGPRRWSYSYRGHTPTQTELPQHHRGAGTGEPAAAAPSAPAAQTQPRLFLAGLRTANASAEALLGAARRKGADVASGLLGRGTGRVSSVMVAVQEEARQRAIDVEEGLGPGEQPRGRGRGRRRGLSARLGLGLGPRSGSVSSASSISSPGPGEGEQDQETKATSGVGDADVTTDNAAASASVAVRGDNDGNGNGSGSPFLRRRVKGNGGACPP
ncbi:hypothetical protein F5X99DRAFT_404989 [Biscogniauxia marginata]|nr:hypothetical protein F5X99DRAFT_404989 [Biscogniauxia marginata]